MEMVVVVEPRQGAKDLLTAKGHVSEKSHVVHGEKKRAAKV